MFPSWLRNHLSLKNLLTLVCGSLALFLIYQEFVTLTVTKPTTTSREERELETSDLPEVVVCLVPGFDRHVTKKYNYSSPSFFCQMQLSIFSAVATQGLDISYGCYLDISYVH